MMMDPAELQNRQRVDEEIACLMRTVQTLRTYRNTMVPINKLPPEILSHIFTYGTGLRSLPATVCSHWRAISLQCPSLWRDLIRPYHSHPEWTALLLERSKNAPIRLDLHKVEELRIIGELESFSHYLLSFKDPTPLLEDLSLKLDSGFRGDASSSMIPDSFFPSTPRLRYLSLVNCVVRWDRPIFQNLIELRIIRMPWMSNQGSDGLDVRFSTAQLLAILETNPALQTLQLGNAVQAVHFDTVPDEVRVSLPHLIRLQLEDPLGAVQPGSALHWRRSTELAFSLRIMPISVLGSPKEYFLYARGKVVPLRHTPTLFSSYQCPLGPPPLPVGYSLLCSAGCRCHVCSHCQYGTWEFRTGARALCI
ncbi:hypothetical protein PLICRDRAFT_262306 [Plicaturopsis crispa FD-325 SS-3]|nr:hypothetical protein PLICRDRAFT_262306 [Plicaturopsis crispa FD-325 SS-3]